MKHHATKCIRLPELLEELHIARGEGTYKKVLTSYKKYKLLIFNKWLIGAILDRILHNSYEITIEGDISMREHIGRNQ